MKKVLLFVQDNELLTKQASMIISFTRTDGILLFHDKKNSQGHALLCEAHVLHDTEDILGDGFILTLSFTILYLYILL